MAKVKSLRSTKKNQESLKDKDVDNVIVSNTKNNIWVRLPDKDDEDLSDVDIDNQAEQEINDWMKIKVEAQLWYDRMAKIKTKKNKK